MEQLSIAHSRDAFCKPLSLLGPPTKFTTLSSKNTAESVKLLQRVGSDRKCNVIGCPVTSPGTFRMNLFRFTLFCYTLDITVEETMASLEAQLKQALEQHHL
jgi:hypothetical protein